MKPPLPPDHGLPRRFAGGTLRRLRPSDLAAFQAYRALPELGRYQGWTPMSDGDAADFLQRMAWQPLFLPGHWLQVAISDPGVDTLWGDLGIHLAEDGLTSEIGFTLAPAAQGRGIATAAVEAAIDWIFKASPARRVLANADSRNLRSLRLLERAGFSRRGSHAVVFRDEPCRELHFVRERKPPGVE